jgi:hypothetical protein
MFFALLANFKVELKKKQENLRLRIKESSSNLNDFISKPQIFQLIM